LAVRKPAKTIGVETYKHDETRKNIPTEELREFAPDVGEPQTLLWPRDPSLDPQLVWKGKDEQDRSPLEVPVVPVYIQEKIQPRAIIEDLRAVSKGDAPPQLSLFAEDFNGLDFDKLIDFYHHDQDWTNRMILGDSLLVMTSLAEKEGLRGKVQTIYMDPPYGIRFGSNWQASTAKRDVKDGAAGDFSQEPEVIRAFRDTWELGVNSYLSYLRDRIVAARELLADSGSIFVQIGDENAHLVRSLLDEAFGSSNFVATLNFRSMNPLESGQIESVYDHIHWYARDREQLKYRNLWIDKPSGAGSEFIFADDPASDLGYRRLTPEELASRSAAGDMDRFKRSDLISSGYTASCTFPITFDGRTITPASGKSWRTNVDGVERLEEAERLFFLGTKLYYKLYLSDFPMKSLENTWTDTAAGILGAEGVRGADSPPHHRALPAHDHGPGRPGLRPHRRQRHHRLRLRALGPSLDHDRYQPCGHGSDADPAYGRPLSLLRPRGL
jgi:adenine-specific DNA-methyltransferase